MMVRELLMPILLIKTVQSISAKMYYVFFTKIFYYKEKTQLVGLFLTKGVLKFMVKILDKYTSKVFLKITF